MALDRKYERDIDIFLAEEFSVSPAFASWILSQTVRFSGVNASVTDVFVSKADNMGESDLVVIFTKADNDARFALLIEDKIDAPFQPDQVARYRRRAEAEIKRGQRAEYGEAEVILCAPQIYLEAHADQAKDFDSRISFEQIATFMNRSSTSERETYRAKFIGTAAKRTLTNYVPKYDPETDKFWKAVYDLATQDFSPLEMKDVRLVTGSTWITFRPQGMPSLPKMINVNVKGSLGVVDLSFSRTLNSTFQPLIRSLLEEDMTAHQTGNSASVRLRVVQFKTDEPFESALPKAKVSLEAAVRLIGFFRKHRNLLMDAATKSLLTESQS